MEKSSISTSQEQPNYVEKKQKEEQKISFYTKKAFDKNSSFKKRNPNMNSSKKSVIFATEDVVQERYSTNEPLVGEFGKESDNEF